jgi:hypothetical protein
MHWMNSNLRFRAPFERELLNANLNEKCSEYKLYYKLNPFGVTINVFTNFITSSE